MKPLTLMFLAPMINVSVIRVTTTTDRLIRFAQM